MLNPFIGMDQPTLEAALTAAQADLAAGKTVIEAEVPGIRSRNQLDLSPIERIRLILKALNILDPITYPIDQISPSNITRAVFSQPNADQTQIR